MPAERGSHESCSLSAGVGVSHARGRLSAWFRVRFGGRCLHIFLHSVHSPGTTILFIDDELDIPSLVHAEHSVFVRSVHSYGALAGLRCNRTTSELSLACGDSADHTQGTVWLPRDPRASLLAVSGSASIAKTVEIFASSFHLLTPGHADLPAMLLDATARS